MQENACFSGIRGVFFECGRITKADDVVDWIFGLMRAVRDAGPYNVIATKFVKKYKVCVQFVQVNACFLEIRGVFFGLNRFSKTKKDLSNCKAF